MKNGKPNHTFLAFRLWLSFLIILSICPCRRSAVARSNLANALSRPSRDLYSGSFSRRRRAIVDGRLELSCRANVAVDRLDGLAFLFGFLGSLAVASVRVDLEATAWVVA